MEVAIPPDRVTKALDGKPASKGGLSIPELKKALLELIPDEESIINKTTLRSELEAIGRTHLLQPQQQLQQPLKDLIYSPLQYLDPFTVPNPEPDESPIEYLDWFTTFNPDELLYHGAFYKYGTWPRDGQEIPLRYEMKIPETIKGYNGAWFSAQRYSLTRYALTNALTELAQGKKLADNPIQPSVAIYRVVTPISRLLDIDANFHRIRELPSVLEKLAERGDIKLKCPMEDIHTAFRRIGTRDYNRFTQTNFYLAGILYQCVDGINGWVHLSDDSEVYLTHPELFLELEDKFIITAVADKQLNNPNINLLPLIEKDRDFIVSPTGRDIARNILNKRLYVEVDRPYGDKLAHFHPAIDPALVEQY